MELKDMIISLCSIMSVSGHETREDDKLTALLSNGFDECITDALHNHIFVKRSAKENAPKILIDTHFDEIGMIVSGISKDGFVSVAPIGGLDTRILQAGEVIIYGKEPIYGVIASTPPHLQKPTDADKLKPIEELYIDTGIPKEELEELVSLGAPVGFKPIYTELMNGRIFGKGFDDKACAACAASAIFSTAREELAGDVYLVLSAQEEVGLRGAKVAGFGVSPDYALVLDVTHASTPDNDVKKDIALGTGVAVCRSAITDRRLTDAVENICRDKEIEYSVEVCPMSTGTNANVLGITADGIPTALVSLPIKSMHSSAETLALEDAEALRKFVGEFIKTEVTLK